MPQGVTPQFALHFSLVYFAIPANRAHGMMCMALSDTTREREEQKGKLTQNISDTCTSLLGYREMVPSFCELGVERTI
jgi:hypothetical protein